MARTTAAVPGDASGGGWRTVLRRPTEPLGMTTDRDDLLEGLSNSEGPTASAEGTGVEEYLQDVIETLGAEIDELEARIERLEDGD